MTILDDDWEKKLREKLERELPDGAYRLLTDNGIIMTGKGGKINFEIEFEREIRRLAKDN